MKGYKSNIENETLSNSNFRKVLFTGIYCQLVVMCLKPGEEIGEEVHKSVDQFFRVEKGDAKVKIDDDEYELSEDEVIIVPAGALHNVTNASMDTELKLYTIYSPPNHPEGTIHKDKAEADLAEQEVHH